MQTEINIKAKGNIKIEYKTVTFKTDLLTNTDFKNVLDNWKHNGYDTDGVYEIDNNINYNGHKAMRIFENANSTSFFGPTQILKVKLDSAKRYELSAYFYRDGTSSYGDLNNIIRMYATLGDENGIKESWLKLDNAGTVNNSTCLESECFSLNKNTLTNKTWTYVSATSYPGNPSVGTTGINLIYNFSIDYLAGGNKNSTSNIWIAMPHLYEIEEKSIRKGNKIENLPIPTKEGYTFTGWFTDIYGGEKINENEIIKINEIQNPQ